MPDDGLLQIKLAADPTVLASIKIGKKGGTLTDYQDTIQTNYSTTPVFGRMDPIVSYQNSPRSISFAVQFTNPDTGNQTDVQEFIVQVMALQYPTYKNINNALSIARPPLVRVSLEGLLTDQLCAMKGFAFTPQAGFTPQKSPEIPFGQLAKDDSGNFTRGTSLTTTFKTVTAKFDFIVLHEDPIGFDDDDLLFFGSKTRFGFSDLGDFSKNQ